MLAQRRDSTSPGNTQGGGGGDDGNVGQMPPDDRAYFERQVV